MIGKAAELRTTVIKHLDEIHVLLRETDRLTKTSVQNLEELNHKIAQTEGTWASLEPQVKKASEDASQRVRNVRADADQQIRELQTQTSKKLSGLRTSVEDAEMNTREAVSTFAKRTQIAKEETDKAERVLLKVKQDLVQLKQTLGGS